MRITVWNIIYLAGFVVYVAIRGVFDARTKGNEKAVSRTDLLDRALLVPVFLGNVVLPACIFSRPGWPSPIIGCRSSCHVSAR
jgi:hypothetical protein